MPLHINLADRNLHDVFGESDAARGERRAPRLLESAPAIQVVQKPFVILFEECVVFVTPGLGRKTMRKNCFHQDLFDLGLVFEDLHRLRDEVIQRHGIRVSGLKRASQLSLNIRRHNLDDSYRVYL